ncbi:MAG: hypothetical protein AAF636_22965 [Pseudomonadota bacterium]
MENLSFQPPAFVGLGIAGGDVGLAGSRQVEACVGECVDHRRAVGDEAHIDLILYPGVSTPTELSPEVPK